jgi:hypothetical protein
MLFMSRNIVVIAGIETVRDKDGTVKKFSQAFMNNARTIKKDLKDDNVVIVDARDFVNETSPIDALWDAVVTAHTGLIDEIFYTGHSDPEGLYVFSKVRKELPEGSRYLTAFFHWEAPLSEDGCFRFNGCQAGGMDGVKFPNSLAQIVADRTRHVVWAYTSKSAQIRRQDGGYEQRPDIKGFVKFTPRPKSVDSES